MEVYHYIFGITIIFSFIHLSRSADKPSGLSQGIYCEGCIATVKELLKKVDKKTGDSREVRVIDGMEDICNLQNFGSYDYSPPKTGQACKYLIENYDEEIEGIMLDEGKSEYFEKKICFELSEACKGVDRTKKEKEELEVNINDKKQKIHTGDPKKEMEQFNVDINEEGAAEKLVNQINMAIKDKEGTGGGDDDNDNDDNDDDNEIDDDDDSDMDNVDTDEVENLTDKFEKDTKTEL
ncbi:glutamic acid-rich protein-like [Dendronephthya gigantea]|uniref:glutamic acid-rich protein-like n=1 Tax=Dendronephthya gigantea TaxID=151771 RepID=UPI00106CC80C|nr:glutamic acid-rich protein-like [Dendronephthya gigantea]